MNANQPLVIIRCTTYNHEPYIRDCLEGFVMQHTTFPFYAIVHDDASIDGTASIVQEYAEKYPDIIHPIIETENQYSKHDGSLRRIMDGASKKANYIAFCEGDDYWTDPLKLQKQVDFLEEHKEFDMCCTRFIHLYENNKEYDECDLYSEIINDTELGKELKKENFLTGSIPHPCTFMYRNGTYQADELIKKLKYKYDIPSLWCFMSFHRVWLINERTAVYRKHIGSLTDRNDLSKFTTFYETYKDIYKYDKDCVIRNLYYMWFKKYLLQYIKYSKRYSFIHIISAFFEFIKFKPSWSDCKGFSKNVINAHKYRIKTGRNERLECMRF